MDWCDQLLVDELAIETSVGVFDWEKEVKQCLLLSLVAEYDFSKAEISDQVDDTVSYADLCMTMTEVTQSKHHELLEHLAHNVCSTLLSRYPLKSVDLTIKKPGAVENAKGVGIRVRRCS